LVGRNLDAGRFLLALLERADDPPVELPQHLVLFERRHADEDGDAIAEERDDPAVTGAERHWNGRKDVVALKPDGVDTLANQQSARNNAAFGLNGLIAHRRTSRTALFRGRERAPYRLNLQAASDGGWSASAREPDDR